MKKYVRVMERECAWTKRYLGPTFYLSGEPSTEHGLTHSGTYLGLREGFKKDGQVMGFDNEDLEERVQE